MLFSPRLLLKTTGHVIYARMRPEFSGTNPTHFWVIKSHHTQTPKIGSGNKSGEQNMSCLKFNVQIYANSLMSRNKCKIEFHNFISKAKLSNTWNC